MRPVLVAMFALAACGPSDSGTGCKEKFLPGDLVITEVFADFAAPAGGTGTDTGKEWFEIYNNTERPVNLKGLTIVHSRPDGSKAQSHTMTDVTVAPGQYFTLGNATQDLVPAYVDYGYSADLGDFYNADGGKLALKCTDTEIDSAVYDGVKSGHSRELTSSAAPDYTLNDDLANWCQGDATEFESGNFGTPGAESDCQPVIVGQCMDGATMRDTVPPAVGDLVITEVMPKPKTLSATTAQWFEVRAMKDVDLNGVGLDRANDTNVKPEVLSSPSCIHVAAGSFAVFARSADVTMNGGITTTGTFSFSLNPTTVTPDVQVVYGADIIDSVTWPTSTTGTSRQLDKNLTDAASNDDPANFCDTSATTLMHQYEATGPNYGSPGAENEVCPTTLQPGQCMDTGGPRAIVKPAMGQLVISELMANPAGTGTDSAQEWFEITNTGATAFDLNGLTLMGSASNTITSTACKSVPAGMQALFAHSTDSAVNGGLMTVDATFTFALANSNGSLSVLDGATTLDQITWGGTQQGGSTNSGGLSNQLKPGNTNTTDNDDATWSTGPNYCPALTTQIYGSVTTNYGTPRAPNVCM